eukprot:SAG31_NODE_1141_length_9699_cov_4.487604_3_plen_46_part_00
MEVEVGARLYIALRKNESDTSFQSCCMLASKVMKVNGSKCDLATL